MIKIFQYKTRSGNRQVYFLSLLLLFCTCFSCHKQEINKFYPDRLFQPTTISVTGGDTAVIIRWNASPNGPDVPVSYSVEISDDSTFVRPPALTLTVDSLAVRVTNESLKDRHPYFARVRANANDRSQASGWLADTVRFSFIGVQLFKPLLAADILDKSVKFHWVITAGVSAIELAAAGHDTLKVPISTIESDAAEKVVSGLTPGTAYSAEIIVGTKSKGLLKFTTKSSLTGPNIIDLTASTSSTVLMDTLPVVPSGSIIVLSRGQSYDMSGFNIEKSLTFTSALGYGKPATLALSGNFDAGGSIDSIQFIDLVLQAAGSNYLLNMGSSGKISKMVLENCRSSGTFNNSLIRLKTGDAIIEQLTINNCIISDIGIGAKYAVLYANGSSSAVINNIQISNSTFSEFYYFIRQDKVAASSLSISNCTFNNFINQGGYFVNYSGSFPSSFTVSNTIFGATLDPTNANGIKSSANATFSNCYQTSDCLFSAEPFAGPNNYPGTASDLFSNPAQGDFSIKDAGFAGRSLTGDPRWRN